MGIVKRSERGRALFYSRDSSGRHEMTPAQYVAWAQRKATEIGLQFDGTGERMTQLIREKCSFLGDLFFDSAISGNLLDRPALQALKAEIVRDRTVSHLLIPRRDRLARPDQAFQGVELENELRSLGVAIEFMNGRVGPMSQRQRQDLGEGLAAFIDYHNSGSFRDELAEKMIFAQLELARQGFSTGGRPPFGFCRFLVGPDRQVVRELKDGEIVRQKGHHVVWLPGPEQELDLIRRILRELEIRPASQLAKLFNEEGIPSPDAGRMRTDGGVVHVVSGKWNPSTLNNIARNPLLRAITQYGLRSMGDRRRVTPEGPRPVDDQTDLRVDGQPKVIRNRSDQLITAPSYGEPIVPAEQAEKLIEILDRRGATQRGKPRSRDPGKNPLGGKVFDIACAWPMYRTPVGKKSFHYTCGYYQQSHGQACAHNHIDGTLLTRFALAAIRQRLFKPGMRERLEARLRMKFQVGASAKEGICQTKQAQMDLTELESQLKTAMKNLALEKDSVIYVEMKTIVMEMQSRRDQLKSKIQRQSAASPEPPSIEAKVAAALQEFDQLPGLADDPENLPAIGELFQRVDVQLYLRFEPVKLTKRTVNRLQNGIITLGAVPPPIQKYSGATSCAQVKETNSFKEKKSPAATATGLEKNSFTDDQVESSRNVNRGDKTPIELFIAGVRGWEPGLRRYFPGKSDG